MAPHHFWGRSFDFTGLNEQQFESFCRDLLLSLGFINVQIRGNIRAADGGVDITADEEYCTLISSERRKSVHGSAECPGALPPSALHIPQSAPSAWS